MELASIMGTQLLNYMADMPKNMLAQKSKAGMTTTMALNILTSVDTRKNRPQVVCLTQTEEKARQIGAAIEQIGKYMLEERKIIYAARGNKPARGSEVKHHIIIGTPGEVLDWCKKLGFFSITLINLFVLTEADIMIATQGYRDQCLRLHRMLSNTCQVILTSKTIDNSVLELVNKIVSDPQPWVQPWRPAVLDTLYNQESMPISYVHSVLCNQETSKTLSEIYRAIMIHCQGRKSDSNTASDITRSPADEIAGGVGEYDNMDQWTVDEVSQFIQSLEGCGKYAQMFRDQEIDGCILSNLTEEDLKQKMGIKLGPAIKIRMSVMKRLPCPWDPSQPNS